MKIFTHYALMMAGFLSLIIMSSCGDDDSPAPTIMVAIESSTGILYAVDETDGSTTEIGTVMMDGSEVLNIRAMQYHTGTKMIYASSTDDGSGVLYSIEPTTLEATVINDNADDEWYGVAGMVINDDDQIMTDMWFKSSADVGYGAGLAIFETSGTMSSSVLFSLQEICCGMGMVYDDDDNVLIGSADNGFEIFRVGTSGTVNAVTSFTYSDETVDVGDLYIRSLTKDRKGNIYALVYNSDTGNTLLCSVDMDEATFTELGQVNSTSDTNAFQGLMTVKENVLM